MSTARPSLTNEEVARRGDEIYNRLLRARLEPDQNGKIIAIDVDSEDYEVGTDVLDVAHRLRARRPDALIYFLRVGDRVLHRLRSPRRRVIGSFADDDTLPEICAEIYRQRDAEMPP
jgi:hypothetical protein